MITLATLNKATLQQIFDQVVNHLLTQNKQARLDDLGTCQYRTKDGLKCAVGCLISDDEYDPKMDKSLPLCEITGLHYTDDKYKLLSNLQSIHDLNKPEDWPSALKQLATNCNLQYNHDNTSNA